MWFNIKVANKHINTRMAELKKKKLLNIRLSKLLVLTILTLFFLLFTESKNINHAKILGHCNDIQAYFPKFENEFIYYFKIKDKLNGSGEIKLSIFKNKIIGVANGLGKITQCNVDFHTNIDGKFDCSNSCIEVTVSGEGDPLNLPIPGKVKFYGPLKGFIHNKKLCLSGKISLKGRLAKLAGFKKTEDLEIEIPMPTENLASLS